MNQVIEKLRAELGRLYGERVRAYASSHNEIDGYAFAIEGIPATFSAITRGGSLAADQLDVQIESSARRVHLHGLNWISPVSLR